MKQKKLTAALTIAAIFCVLTAGCSDTKKAEEQGIAPPADQQTTEVQGASDKEAEVKKAEEEAKKAEEAAKKAEETAPPAAEPEKAPQVDLGRLARLTTDEGSCVTTWIPDRKVALVGVDGKGVGCYQAFVNNEGKVLLEGTEEAIWATADGYARVIFCLPGTTEPVDSFDLYEYFDAVEYGEGTDTVYDAYVERYDMEGNFIDRQALLSGDGYWDRLSEGQKLCPPLGGAIYAQGETRVNSYSLYTGDYSSYDQVNYEAVDGGFTVYDGDGSVIGTIPSQTENRVLIGKDKFIFVVEENKDYNSSYLIDVYYIND